jgi:hypothetical protein
MTFEPKVGDEVAYCCYVDGKIWAHGRGFVARIGDNGNVVLETGREFNQQGQGVGSAAGHQLMTVDEQRRRIRDEHNRKARSYTVEYLRQLLCEMEERDAIAGIKGETMPRLDDWWRARMIELVKEL